MPKRPTQTDVAKLAGVSRATVSYILTDRLNNRIPITTETRRKVLQAAKQLGYQPNAMARSLRSGQSQIIGLLTPDVHNPHYLDVLDGVEQEAAEHNYHLILVSANLDLENERRCMHSLFERRLDGLILMSTFSDLLTTEIEVLSEHTSPAVFMIPTECADWVYPDVRSGAEQMMDHLLSLGHQRIGFIDGVARSNLSQPRQKVYEEKLTSVGLPIDEQLIRHCGHTMQDGYLAARALLDLTPRPTAIWTINDLLAVGALRAIYERCLHIPQDVALAGFDDIALASQLYPPLTTVHMPAKEMGCRAVQILFHRIENPQLEPMQEMLSLDLIIRQSTVPNPGGESI